MSGRRFRSTSCGKCSLGLRLLWWPEYRRGILGGRVARYWGGLPEIARTHSWQTVAKEVMPDHVHLFVGVGPADAPAQIVRAFNYRTARMLRQEFCRLSRFAKVLWLSYFAASFGYVAASTTRSYIEHQWDAVMAS